MSQQAAVTFYPRTVVSRTDQLGVAHDLARKLGYETRKGKPGRERYEDRLYEIVGIRTLAKASREQRNTVVRAFEAELQARRGLTYAADDYSDEAMLELLG